jgi:AraC-like DNA-binding protein
METFFESLAHYTLGMTTTFFVFIAILLYQKRRQNGLVRFLFRVVVFWAATFLKDIVYLVDGLWLNDRVNHIVVSIDMLCMPVFAVFLFEVVKPGWANFSKVSLVLMPTIIPAAIVIATDSTDVFRGLLLYSNLFAVVTAILLLHSAARFDRYIKMNYSYTETISIHWLRTVVIFMLLLLCVWSAVTWAGLVFGKSLYEIASVAVFTYVYLRTMRHHIVPVSVHDIGEEPPRATDTAHLGVKLAHSMEERRMFLDPMLTLREVAAATGTNRTYLSEYLNRELDTNFYDYINSYRVKEAGKLLREDKNAKLEEISERCGFNSLSTFQRSFAKIKGMTPAKYRVESADEQVFTQ